MGLDKKQLKMGIIIKTMKRIVAIMLFLASFCLADFAAKPKNCYDYDTDYEATNINNGLEQRTDSEYECQVFCQVTVGCEGFTWASDEYFDVKYRRSCWAKKDIIGKAPVKGVVAGPQKCGSDPGGDCCSNLELKSTGSLVDSVQNHVLGIYKKHSEGPEGRWNYKQQGGFESMLFYYPSLQLWYINSEVGVNLGFAMGVGTAKCPEDLGPTWRYWDDAWIDDPEADMHCIDNPPDPEPDQCCKGLDCDGCGLTVDWQGETYCCNNYCDWGWINVDPATDPLCQCGHDNSKSNYLKGGLP